MTLPNKIERYSVLRGSDLDRDGMYLEVAEKSNESKILFEVFYSDETQQLTISTFEQAIPLEIVEAVISRAKEVLPPIPRDELKIEK